MAKVDALTGKIVQGWNIHEELGKGADGIVYSAERDGKTAAIKFFFPEILKKNGLSAAYERLELQRSLIGKKHHPNLVEIYDAGEESELETLFIVMELVPGTSLDKLIGTVPPADIPHLIAQLTSAAEYLESIDLVHRDIKPANIVVSDDFKTLTLLDLGVIHQALDDEEGRLSGDEFVATLRYSPPEFVWREEGSELTEAWRAVTFYQIGATLYDLIMGKTIFSGVDTPRAKLYDSVRDLTPEIKSELVSPWIIQIASACLLKDWRQRLHFLKWESFNAPIMGDAISQENKIRLLQIQREERRRAEAKVVAPLPGQTREQKLWLLNDSLISELRTFLINSQVFPMCCIAENNSSAPSYETRFQFDEDLSREFGPGVSFVIGLCMDEEFPDAVTLAFNAIESGEVISSATWAEMFTVDVAFGRCQRAFLDVAEAMMIEKEIK